MEIIHWINGIFTDAPAIKAVVVVCLVCALGLTLGKVRIRGVRLGVTFVFFAGIAAGAAGISIDHDMLLYAESFGLVIFVYVLGLHVGPGFVTAFRSGGTTLNLLALGLVSFGTLLALIPVWIRLMPLGETIGVLCGATTNTPALAAAQQEFTQLGKPDEGLAAALSLAVTYPFGLVGVIIALILMRRMLVHKKDNLEPPQDEAFIASFKVSNPAIFGKDMQDVAVLGKRSFVASRIWRKGRVVLPTGQTRLEEADRVLVITKPDHVKQLTILFGQRDGTDWMKKDIDWNALDTRLISERILVTRREINGKHLGTLHLRERFGVNVSRVKRSGIQLVATPDLVLRFGDRLTVVGSRKSCAKVAEELGNAIKALDEPNMITIFIGMLLGLILGYLPLAFPGMTIPIRLGLAGGPIVMGILIGAFGPRLHMITYVTTSANRLISSLGLSTYLACLGLDAGPQFVETVMRPAAFTWIGLATLLAIIPVCIVAVISIKIFHRSFATTAGMLCGAMANPIALEYVNDTTNNDKASVSYATVYPIGMFVRVIVAQIFVMLFLS